MSEFEKALNLHSATEAAKTARDGAMFEDRVQKNSESLKAFLAAMSALGNPGAHNVAITSTRTTVERRFIGKDRETNTTVNHGTLVGWQCGPASWIGSFVVLTDGRTDHAGQGQRMVTPPSISQRLMLLNRGPWNLQLIN